MVVTFSPLLVIFTMRYSLQQLEILDLSKNKLTMVCYIQELPASLVRLQLVVFKYTFLLGIIPGKQLNSDLHFLYIMCGLISYRYTHIIACNPAKSSQYSTFQNILTRKYLYLCLVHISFPPTPQAYRIYVKLCCTVQ